MQFLGAAKVTAKRLIHFKMEDPHRPSFLVYLLICYTFSKLVSRITNTVDYERQIRCAEQAYFLEGMYTEVMDDFFFLRSSTIFMVIKYLTI